MADVDGSAPSPQLPRWLEQAVDAAIAVQQPVVHGHVGRLRGRHPDASPAEIVAMLERQYLSAVTGSGTAVGAAAAWPGSGTAISAPLSVSEMASTLDAGMVFALAVAHVHGVEFADLDRRRALLLAVTLGDSGSKFVQKMAERTGRHWGKLLTDRIPMSTVHSINRVLGAQFLTKYGTKKGVVVIGRAAPFMIGAAIGGTGNFLLGRSVLGAVRRAFGPAPAEFVAPLVVDAEIIAPETPADRSITRGISDE